MTECMNRSVVLEGHHVKLVPLTASHAQELAACTDHEAFEYSLDVPTSWDAAGFDGWIDDLLGLESWISFVGLNRADGRIVARSCYIDVSHRHRTVEIGNTWIAPASRGTHVNPEMKFLMLEHAFESWGARRVQLKCDARNTPSHRAILKLGAIEEGTIRKHVVIQDGSVRDSIVLSITDDEWPDVRGWLRDRLGALV